MEIEDMAYSNLIPISEVVHYLEQTIRLCSHHDLYQSGLVVGNMQNIVTGILICLDITEELLDEAIEKNCNFIIANQPLLIDPLHKITPETYAGKCVIKAIRHDLAIYIFGTNLDYLGSGASHRIAKFLELQDTWPIICEKQILYKLTTFVPFQAKKDLIATLSGEGALLNNENVMDHLSDALVKGGSESELFTNWNTRLSLEKVEEIQLTFTFPVVYKEKVIQALLRAHPYRKVSYYLEPIETIVENRGSGVIGTLPVELPAKYFLKYVRTKLNLVNFQFANTHHTNISEKPIKVIAIYAGNGSQLLNNALDKQVDVFITTGLRYEQFLEASGRLLMIDIGYYAVRLGIKKLILALLSKEFNNIVILRCKTITNPIHYIND
ncbi:hypothetical protein CCPUN_00160 [Cardinium endosymbiont of Culicoides punctatus]|nr:hypothetical protein CCPUN_00160 [Cardinium endosymbiont of Culicoides punctatus]